MDSAVKVSVIIPIYNMEEYIAECLDSVTGQTLRDIEVICVDDGSTDNTLEVLRAYAEKDSRIVVLTQENQGTGPASNRAMDQARGEYLAFIGADDLYPNEKVLETLYTAACEHNVKVCGGSLELLNKDGTITPQNSGYKFYFTQFENAGLCNYSDYQTSDSFTCFIYERVMLSENNIRFPDFLRYQDPPFQAKAMICAGTFYHIPDVVYRYRVDHKTIIRTLRKFRDGVMGAVETMEIAKEAGLPILYENVLRHYIFMFFGTYKMQLIDPIDVRKIMDETRFIVDMSYIHQAIHKGISPVLGQKIIVFGTGDTGKSMVRSLKAETSWKLLGVCNSRTEQSQVWHYNDMDLPLCSIQEWKRREPEAIALIATLEEKHAEIIEFCTSAGFERILPLSYDLQLAIYCLEYCRQMGIEVDLGMIP